MTRAYRTIYNTGREEVEVDVDRAGDTEGLQAVSWDQGLYAGALSILLWLVLWIAEFSL